MKSRLKKQMAFCAFLLMVVCGSILLINHIFKKDSSVISGEQVLSDSTNKTMNILKEQNDAVQLEQIHIASDNKNIKEKKSLADSDAVEKGSGIPTERGSRATELNSTENNNVYRGLPNEFENMAATLERIAHESGGPLPVFPYRDKLEEIHTILESKGYDRNELYSHYEDYLKQIGSDWAEKTNKVQEILAVAEATEPSLFILEVEKLFEDKESIGLMLLKVEAYHAQAKVEDLFNEIKDIIIALDDFNSEHVDKNAILYSLLQSASFFGNMLDNVENYTSLKRPKRVSISHPEFLAALELDGKL